MFDFSIIMFRVTIMFIFAQLFNIRLIFRDLSYNYNRTAYGAMQSLKNDVVGAS